MTSVNTNFGALVALQQLGATNRELATVQNRISTGLEVSSARDNGAVFAIAQGQRARESSIGALRDGIDRANNVVDSALTAGSAVSDILNNLRTIATAAQSTDLSTEQRDALINDFNQLRDTINSVVNSATINGANLANGNNGNTLSVLTSDLNSGDVATVRGAGPAAGQATPTLSTLVTVAADTVETSDIAANDFVNFDFADAAGVDFSVQIGAGTTIQDFITSVNTNATNNGRIVASFDSTSGQITFQNTAGSIASAAGNGFTVAVNTAADNSGTARTAASFLEGDGAAGLPGNAGVAEDFANIQGSRTTLTSIDLRVGGGGALADLGNLSLSDSVNATAAANALDEAITNVNASLGTLGSQANALDTQDTFLESLRDTITNGIGQLVDADLARESAELQSLQVRQQLGAQALAIANQAPSIILSFFG